MKRILSLILTVCMVLSLGITTFAEEVTFPTTNNKGIITLKGNVKIDTLITPEVLANDEIVIKTTDAIPNIDSVKMTITGERGERVAYQSTNDYEFVNYIDANCTLRPTSTLKGDYWKLTITKDTATIGQFLANSYNRIYAIEIVATGSFETDSERVYNDWGNTVKFTESVPAFEIVKGFTTDAVLQLTITNLLENLKTFEYVSKQVRVDYSYLVNTDLNYDGIITRSEVAALSKSVLGEGVGVPGFEGLASQVAAFFNKKTNGTITFKVTTSEPTFTASWAGGVPVTQVGIFKPEMQALNCPIGLFFNYEKTGSLVSTSYLTEDGTITFDISDILEDIGTNSLATINSVYYGLVGGLNYPNELIKGLKIEKVTLSYVDEVETPDTENKNVDENEDNDIDEDDTVVEEIDEEEDFIDLDGDSVDEDDAEIEDTDNDETDVQIEDENEVPNPRTGVGLAIGSATIFGLVALLSKKRK